MKPEKQESAETKFERFQDLAKQLFSVPKHKFDKVVAQKPEGTKDPEDKDSDETSESN